MNYAKKSIRTAVVFLMMILIVAGLPGCQQLQSVFVTEPVLRNEQIELLNEILDNLTEFYQYLDSFDAIESEMYAALKIYADEPSPQALNDAFTAIEKAQEAINALPMPNYLFVEDDSDRFEEVHLSIDSFLSTHENLSTMKSNFFLSSNNYNKMLEDMTGDAYTHQVIFGNSFLRDIDHLRETKKSFYLYTALLLCKADADIIKDYRISVIETLNTYTKYDVIWETDRNVIIGKSQLYIEYLKQVIIDNEQRQGDLRMLKLTNSDYFIPVKLILECQDDILMIYIGFLNSMLDIAQEPPTDILESATAVLREAQSKAAVLKLSVPPKPEETRHDFSFFIGNIEQEHEHLTAILDYWDSELNQLAALESSTAIAEKIKVIADAELTFNVLKGQLIYVLTNQEMIFEKNADTFWEECIQALDSYRLYGLPWESDLDELNVKSEDILEKLYRVYNGE